MCNFADKLNKMAENRKFSPKEFYRRHPIICNLIFIAATGLVLLWGVLIYLDFWTLHGSTAVVPEIKNKSYAEAASTLSANKLSIEISDSIYDPTIPPGTVIESWPKPGAVVKDGRQVYVTITAFSPKQVTISMPLTGNVSSRQAMSYLRGIGISDIELKRVPSEYDDLVLSASCDGKPLGIGSSIPVTAAVTLTVGSGAELTDSIGELTVFENPVLSPEENEEW